MIFSPLSSFNSNTNNNNNNKYPFRLLVPYWTPSQVADRGMPQLREVPGKYLVWTKIKQPPVRLTSWHEWELVPITRKTLSYKRRYDRACVGNLSFDKPNTLRTMNRWHLRASYIHQLNLLNVFQLRIWYWPLKQEKYGSNSTNERRLQVILLQKEKRFL